MSRLEPPTGIKGDPFVPVGASNRDKRPLSPPLARLAVGPGMKAIFYPGPKDSRDKWPVTKACSVVVLTKAVKLFVQNFTFATQAKGKNMMESLLSKPDQVNNLWSSAASIQAYIRFTTEEFFHVLRQQ